MGNLRKALAERENWPTPKVPNVRIVQGAFPLKASVSNERAVSGRTSSRISAPCLIQVWHDQRSMQKNKMVSNSTYLNRKSDRGGSKVLPPQNTLPVLWKEVHARH